MVDLLSQMIATPSVTGNEEAVSDLLTKYLSSRGCAPRRFGLNVVALSDDFNSSRPTLMLNSHLDTVAPVAGWQRDAFSPVVEGERLDWAAMMPVAAWWLSQQPFCRCAERRCR